MRIGAAGELGVSDQVPEFYASNWNRAIALALPSFYEWQFRCAPERTTEDDVCVAVIDGRVIGAMGLHQRSFNLAGRLCDGAELTTWVVAEEARGTGAGRGIISYLTSRYSVLLGAGISDAALPTYLQSGFNFLRNLPRYFRVFDATRLGSLAKIESLGNKLAMQRRPVAGNVSSQAVKAAELATSLELNGFARDERNLAWRYDCHPVFAYEAYRIGGGGVVLRRDDVEGLRFAHVVEMFPRGNWEQVLRFLDAYGLDHGLAFIDCTMTASEFGGRLVSAGWFSVLDESFLQLSNLFHPPEFRPQQTTSLIYRARQGHEELCNLGRLYVTKGDLDLDRPTLHYYKTRGLL